MKLNKFFIALCIPLSLFLAGCDPETAPPVISTKLIVVDIPKELYAQCPEIGKLPKSATLRDRQVARLVVRLYNNNIKCRLAIDNIRKYLDNAKREIEQK